MGKKKTYGKTKGGVPIDDELVDKLATEAEAGYDVEETLRRRPGRPPIGAGPACPWSRKLSLRDHRNV